MAADAKIRLTTEGGRQVAQAVKGTRRELERGAKDVERIERDAARETEQQERRKVRARRQSSRDSAREAERLAETEERVQREATREFEKQGRRRTQATKREAREQRRARSQALTPLREAGRLAARGVGLAGGAALAGASTFVAQGQAYGGALGARSREQLVADAATFERGLQSLAAKRGYSDVQTEGLRSTINQTATATGVDQQQLLEGLNQAQSKFADQFGFFADRLPELARAAQASGARLEDVITFMGNTGRAFQDFTPEQLSEALALTVDVGNRGSVEFGALAATFGSIPGEAVRGMQRGGMEGFREMLQVSQLMAAGGTTDSEAATMYQRMLQRLNRTDVQRKFQQMTGESLTDEQGRLRGVPDIIRTMNAQGLNTPQKMQQLLGADIMSSRGIGILQTAIQNDEFVSGLDQASAAGGNAYIEDFYGRGNRSGWLQAASIGINQMNEVQEQGGLQSEAMRALVDRADTQAKLEAKYREVIDTLEVFKSALLAIGGMAVVGKLTGMGGAAAAAAGGSGLLASGGGAAAAGGGAAAAGGSTLGLGAVAPLAIAGAAGYGVGTGIDKLVEAQTGQALSSRIGEEIATGGIKGSGVGALPEYLQTETTRVRGLDPTAERIHAGDPENTVSIKDQVQERFAQRVGDSVRDALGDNLAEMFVIAARRMGGGPRSR